MCVCVLKHKLTISTHEKPLKHRNCRHIVTDFGWRVVSEYTKSTNITKSYIWCTYSRNIQNAVQKRQIFTNYTHTFIDIHHHLQTNIHNIRVQFFRTRRTISTQSGRSETAYTFRRVCSSRGTEQRVTFRNDPKCNFKKNCCLNHYKRMCKIIGTNPRVVEKCMNFLPECFIRFWNWFFSYRPSIIGLKITLWVIPIIRCSPHQTVYNIYVYYTNKKNQTQSSCV